MKIELDIPDWCEDSYLCLMKGIELVAFKYPNEKWMVKTVRCNKCGKCCMFPEGKEVSEPPFIIDGKCEYLVNIGKEWWCKLGSGRPWSCCMGVPSITRKEITDCSETFE